MMEKRKMKKGDDAADLEEEVVDEMEEGFHCEHDHNHHHHEGEKGAAKEAVAVPKKPLNGYMRYVAEIREAVTAEFSELTPKELVSALASFD